MHLNLYIVFCVIYVHILFTLLQSKIISIAAPVTDEAIIQVLSTNLPESMGIADLGCSSGPNTLSVISEIIDVIYSKCCLLGRPPPELRISLNDLYSNDFNDIFGSLPAFYNRIKEEKGTGLGPCFISGVPGSFYGRLFPSKSLHFVHSSSSLHWLSQVSVIPMLSIYACHRDIIH
jgi:jasmonate O-methyltransferase